MARYFSHTTTYNCNNDQAAYESSSFASTKKKRENNKNLSDLPLRSLRPCIPSSSLGKKEIANRKLARCKANPENDLRTINKHWTKLLH